MEFIEVNITPEMLKYAEEAKANAVNSKRTFREGAIGEGDFIGALGEAATHSVIGGELKHTFDYDIIHKGLKYDVKTKKCKFKPKPTYEMTIPTYYKQNNDRYIFCRVLEDYSKVFILGWYPSEQFFKDGISHKKNEIDPNSEPNYPFPFKVDGVNLPIHRLYRIQEEFGV